MCVYIYMYVCVYIYIYILTKEDLECSATSIFKTQHGPVAKSQLLAFRLQIDPTNLVRCTAT